VRWRLKPEGDRVADIQVPDVLPAGFDALRLDNDVSDGIGKAAEARSNRNRRRDF
jgi:hypothetical protein